MRSQPGRQADKQQGSILQQGRKASSSHWASSWSGWRVHHASAHGSHLLTHSFEQEAVPSPTILPTCLFHTHTWRLPSLPMCKTIVLSPCCALQPATHSGLPNSSMWAWATTYYWLVLCDRWCGAHRHSITLISHTIHMLPRRPWC